MRLPVLPLVLALAALPVHADEKVDLATVHRIKAEAFQNGKVADHLFWLTDANGPRLTNSPGHRAAADWALRTLKGWGATNAHLEGWPFGRGWSVERYAARLLEPGQASLGGVPKAWCGGTSGPVLGGVVLAPLFERTEAAQRWDLAKLQARIARYAQEQQGKLRGRFVLLDPARTFEPTKEQEGPRIDDATLAKLLVAPEPKALPALEWPIGPVPADAEKRWAYLASFPHEVSAEWFERRQAVWAGLWSFLEAEGVLGVFTTDGRGDGGTVFSESAGSWQPKGPRGPPVVALAPEPYNRLVRLVEHQLAPKVELDLAVKLQEQALDALNVLAELPGGKRKDEVVMLGAHLDSWHGATGATDNAAGVAVMMEAVRILQALKLPLDRTVRIALWGGEEQGHLGSRAYVKAHLADPVTMAVRPEHARLSAYFNLDNGGGKIRGVWLQGNDMVRPIFEQWLAPLRDLGATALSIQDTGGTDHESFDAVGLPGFQFLQDPLDYMSRTHHSDLDAYDHVKIPDLQQAAAVVALFVYQAANRPELLPRKPLPAPLPPRKPAP
jgi:carboxypeptidase Q